MAITGSQPAYLSCRAGIERAGASRAGAYDYAVTIRVGGVDVAADVVRSTLTVTQSINDTPASARFTLKPNPARAPITVGTSVVVGLDFGGQVLRCTRRYLQGVGEVVPGHPTPFVDVECIDWSRLLNRRLVTGHWSAQSVSTIAALILEGFTMGFSGAAIAPNLPYIDDFPVTNETVTSVLMRLATLIDGDFYIDADKVVHLFGQAGDPSPVAGTPPAPLVLPHPGLHAYSDTSDASQIRTEMIVESQSTTIPLSTPTGSTTISVDASAFVDYLVLAGGGGGSTFNDGGGGGAGDLASGTDTIKSGSYAVSIGAGGVAATQGQPSSFNAHTVLGGTPGAEAAGGVGGVGGNSGGRTGGASAAQAAVSVQVLVVAGGGGGGEGAFQFGGGGGGGGVIRSSFFPPAGSYAIVVGPGGLGSVALGNNPPQNGGNSSAFTFTATGGGGGGMAAADLPSKLGKAGGSGGGSASSDQPNNPGGAGTGGQGSAGGAGDQSGLSASGGGGGASQPGAQGSGHVGGKGGDGLAWGPGTWGGGGGGNGAVGYGNGGTGGGGRGGGGGNPGVAGAPNTGGGGGGGGYDGGSGVVIIIYPAGTATATGGTITPFGGYTMHTFTASGTFTVANTQAGGGGAGTGGGGVAAGPAAGGAGGPGTTSSISGVAAIYGGGGAGHGDAAWGAPGSGGGGGVTTDGFTNSGSGGGAVGGRGGSGIVILSYVTGTLTGTGGAIAQVGGRTIHTFTASGTFTVAQIVLTSPPPLITDFPVEDATQLDAAGGHVRIGYSTYPYLGTGGAPPTQGGNPPGSNLSADALEFATAVSVDDARIFATAPGWVKIGDQYVRYAASSNTAPGTLTGIPAVGFGALYAAVTKATQATWLQMVRLAAAVMIEPPAAVGDPVVQVVIVDNVQAQQVSIALEGGDGVHQQGVQDSRLSVAGATSRANAELVDFAVPLISATWLTSDMNARAGRLQQVNIDGVVATLMITSVTITYPANTRPQRACVGSTTRPASIIDALVTGMDSST